MRYLQKKKTKFDKKLQMMYNLVRFGIVPYLQDFII